MLLILLPIGTCCLYYFGLYKSQRTNPIWRESRNIFMAILLTTILLGTVIFALKVHYVSRLFVGIIGVSAFLRFNDPEGRDEGVGESPEKKRLEYPQCPYCRDSGKRARELAKTVVDHKEWGLKLLGMVAERGNGHLRKRWWLQRS